MLPNIYIYIIYKTSRIFLFFSPQILFIAFFYFPFIVCYVFIVFHVVRRMKTERKKALICVN